ncbi:WD40 repeat domain-containing protein [uncultured Campylobacter sp.]|uniref:WD40 repeat domain-containing protein n=1 Tax=uncultured Campylobacter sp. TaxID=218934 RepID=UPI0026097161|nr:WD40 repeat domain-containing protein [uncultured Campylobacter sp.]
MKFLPPLLLCACFIYAGNGVATPSGAAGIDAPAKIKHARFILELDANVAVLKNLNGEIYAGLDNGKLYKITISSAENSARNSATGQNFVDQNSASSTNFNAAHNFNAKASVNSTGDFTANSAAVNSLANSTAANSTKQNSAENSTALNSASSAISKTLIFALPSSKNYLDEPMGATIFDVDKLGEKYAFLYNGDAFEKMLGVFAGGKITHYKLPMTGIKNVYFYDENTVILLGLGSEILYFDLPSGKVSFEQKLTIASLGGSAYDRASGTLLISCEGGIVFYFDAKAKKLMSQKSLHKDGIYSVALLGDRMMSGSNDKERSCYYENGDFAKFYNAHFAVFAVALSPELGAFTVGNGVRVIDKAGEIVRSIELDNDIINYLLFEGDYLVGSGYNRYIYFWELK